MASALDEARQVIKEQEAEIERLITAPASIAIVLHVEDPFCYVLHAGALMRQQLNPRVKVEVGTSVLVNAETGSIVGLASHMQAPGPVGVISEILDKYTVIMNVGGAPRTVTLPADRNWDLKEGSRVVLDSSGATVQFALPQREGGITLEISKVHYEDIAGQEEAKEALQETVELPLKHPELFAKYNKAPVKGVMLYGPPGCGKTLLGKALATSLEGGFISVRGPELLNAYVGATEEAIRDIFAQAREYKEKTKKSAVVFIDEADAILGVRGGRNAFMEKTVVPMFLTEMDGLQESSAVVILATNRPDQLDPAITREGRIDRKVRVARPDRAAGEDILALYLGKTLVSGGTVAELAALGADLVYGELELAQAKIAGQVLVLRLRDIVSGALLASIVERAAAIAIKRDLAGGSGPSGVGPDDMRQAVTQVYTQNKHVHHDDAFEELAHSQHHKDHHDVPEATLWRK